MENKQWIIITPKQKKDIVKKSNNARYNTWKLPLSEKKHLNFMIENDKLCNREN